MKTYDETIDAIFAKGDAILEQKKKRSAVIKQTSYAVSGVCAAAIVGVGIWRITDHGRSYNRCYSIFISYSYGIIYSDYK